MNRRLAALLALCALCVFLFAGCKTETQAPPTPPAPAAETDDTAPPAAEPPAAGAEADAVYSFDGLEVPVPADFLDLLVIEAEPEPWSEHWTPLISFSHRASIEAYDAAYPDESAEEQGVGWFGSVTRLDRIGFEDWLSGEKSGSTLFARDGAGSWYLMLRPTDVRVYQPDEAWERLNEWAEALPGQLVERNGLDAYDASELFDADYTYAGEHVELAYRFPGEPMDLAVLSLSQPKAQGRGGIWCVERVHYIYSNYNFTDTHLVFPVAFGVNEAAADYYARLQAECDAGEHPELLTPTGAALDFARRAAWIFGEDVSETDFERIEAVG